MQAIKTTLTLGQTGPEVANLQEALLHFITVNAITVSDTALVNALGAEYAEQLFGSATTALVRLYQTQYSLPLDTQPVLNESTLTSMNNRLAQIPDGPAKTLGGWLKTAAGAVPAGAFTAQLYRATFGGKEPVGDSVSVNAQGRYRFVFSESSARAGKQKGYEVVVTGSDNTAHSSGMTYVYGETLQLDVALPADAASLSEYADIYNEITALTNGELIDAGTAGGKAKIDFLAAETGERADFIALFIEALRIKSLLGDVNAAAVYGLLRNNVAATPEALSGQSKEVLMRALTVAVSGNIIPAMTAAETDAAAGTLRTAAIAYAVQPESGQVPEETAIFRILYSVIQDAGRTAEFIDRYYHAGIHDDAAFWTVLGTEAFFTDLVPDLKAALALALLTGNNPAIVKRVLAALKGAPMAAEDAVPGVASGTVRPQLVAGLSESDWAGIITRAKSSDAGLFFYPAWITGEDDAAKTTSYARYLTAQSARSYPTQAIVAQLAGDGDTPFSSLQSHLTQFLTAHPDFDLRTTPVTAFEGEDGYDLGGIDDPSLFISEIGTVQRLLYLGADYPQMAALAAKGFTSSLRIVRESPWEFAKKMSDEEAVSADEAMPEETAIQIYDAARNVANHSVAIAMSMSGSGSGGGNPPVLTPNNTISVDGQPFDPAHAYAEWRTLFGSLDSCDCCQCQSVYSASAYMTDLLHFLKTNVQAPVHDQLLNIRRPDLQDLLLTCKNANTPVPQIDIVNEMLEDLVAPGIIAGNGTIITGYKLLARQTVADAAMQRAISEYVNTEDEKVPKWNPATNSYTLATVKSPYPTLLAAKYPWSLPYNFYKRQIDTHLGLAGVKGHEIVQRFSKNNRLAAFSDYDYCYEYLGILKQEADIITTAVSATGTDLPEHYGFRYTGGSNLQDIPDPANKGSNLSATPTNWIDVLGHRVDVFLQQTGLSYSELQQLLDCYSLNPFTNSSHAQRLMRIRPNATTVADDTCSLNELKIEGLNADVLRLLYRFVRMARALGWTYYELDRALLALGITIFDSGVTGAALDAAGGRYDGFNSLVQMKHLASTLRISVEDTTTLFTSIDTRPYRDYTGSEPKDIPSLYERIFRNPAVSNISAQDYPFAAGAVFPTAGTPGNVFRNYLAGILNIPANELPPLDDLSIPGSTMVHPDLSILSKIYREALLLKAPGLTVSDWLRCKTWLGIAANFGNAGDAPYNIPVDFGALTPESVIRLATLVREVRDAGLSMADVDYLLQDEMQDTIADDQLNQSLSGSLTALRAALREKWAPGYDAAADTNGAKLLALLKRVTDEDKAARLVSLIQFTRYRS